MKTAQRLTAIIEREEDGFIALCPEFDIASEGVSIEEARSNLIEAQYTTIVYRSLVGLIPSSFPQSRLPLDLGH